MYTYRLIQCIVLLSGLNAIKAYFQGEPLPLIKNLCVTKLTCHECIQTPSCSWCSAPNFNSTERCFDESTSPLEQCLDIYLYNPKDSVIIEINEELSKSRAERVSAGAHISEESYDYEELSFRRIIQIQPQHYSIKLRSKVMISMTYARAEDYPVDLYYLMDLSQSMNEDKDKLSALGNTLADTMKNITSEFMLGFGSFVDKTVMPYTSALPHKLKEPCPNCAPPYGYRNHLPLSRDTSKFARMVKDAPISGNLDTPEGSLDAILQVAVCEDQIRWRKHARRLLLLATDAGFHYAGDGKLGGIVTPNDGKCHLDQTGYYSWSLKQDYPSIAQINSKVKENFITLIFAVTEEVLHIYEQFEKHVKGAVCGRLSNDSSNIVDLIQEQYNRIVHKIEMNYNASSAVGVTFFSRCLNTNGPLIKTKTCNNITLGSQVEFEIELKLIKCPEDPRDWKQTITIYPVGINETLTIDLELLCDCPCEQPTDESYEINSPKCNYNGIYKCGICECDSDHVGKTCECKATQVSKDDKISRCVSPEDNLVCSGRGDCVCGGCQCNVPDKEDWEISGRYCECDNYSCKRYNDQMCSGPDHGTCVCKQCSCKNDWGGDDCSCLQTNTSCIAPRSDEICSGRGVCKCGACVCNAVENARYFGKFCEQCPTCPDRCEEFKHCVQCQMYKTGPLNEKECKACPFTPISIDVVEVNEDSNEIVCAYSDDDDCRYAYMYYFNEDKSISIQAQRERKCPPKIFLMGIVLGIIAAVVLMGLAVLLLWKLMTTIHDRREYAGFKKETMMAKWDTGENPIYKQATSTFKNPMYAGKSD